MTFNSKYSVPGKAKYVEYEIGGADWLRKDDIGFRSCPNLNTRISQDGGWLSKKSKNEIKIDLEILNVSYSLPAQLAHIALSIEESKAILLLEDDWNLLGATKVNEDVWSLAVSFLVNYALYTFENFGVIIGSPEINPCPNGAIDLAWKTTHARLLVNFKQSEIGITGSYYGDLYHNEQAIKNIIKQEDEIIEHLAFWMKNLAK
jgi:hypothetical protein